MTAQPSQADLSRLVALVPVASLEGAKSRLGDRLDPEERQALVLALLERTVAAADGVPAIASVVVVSPDPTVLRAASAQGATPVLQTDRGLNEGLTSAARWAAADGATAVLVVAADLPAISAPTIAGRRAGRRRAARPGPAASSRSSPTATGGARTPCWSARRTRSHSSSDRTAGPAIGPRPPASPP